jgi:hypothetical protein
LKREKKRVRTIEWGRKREIEGDRRREEQGVVVEHEDKASDWIAVGELTRHSIQNSQLLLNHNIIAPTYVHTYIPCHFLHLRVRP